FDRGHFAVADAHSSAARLHKNPLPGRLIYTFASRVCQSRSAVITRRIRIEQLERYAVEFPSPGTPGEGGVRALLRLQCTARCGRTLTPALSLSTGRGRMLVPFSQMRYKRLAMAQ